jgi:hypothetical protein
MAISDYPLAPWPRPHYQAGGGNAHLFYKVHGMFPEKPRVSRARHRSNGVPEGCSLRHYTRDANPDVLRIGIGDGHISTELRRRNPELFDSAATADQCMVLRGEVADPSTLDYFRDAVGLVTALLESGGVAVFDPHMFKWWSADEWRSGAFEPGAAAPRHHVVGRT